MIAEHWAGLTDPNEIDIMLDFARQGRLRGLLFCGTFYILSLPFYSKCFFVLIYFIYKIFHFTTFV